MNFKSSLKKIWNFIWHEDSFASLAVNIVLAFIIIKFIFYPLLGLALGTSYPIVAVISESMEHDLVEKNVLVDGKIVEKYYICDTIYEEDKRIDFDTFWQDCGDYYENISITKSDFQKYPMENGFNKGDIIVLQGKESIEVGDVIVFWTNRAYPIIHRVVHIDDDSYLTKGDHNAQGDGYVDDEKVIGKALFRVPYLGYVKLWAVNLINLFR